MIRNDDVRDSYNLIAEKYADARDQSSSAPFLRTMCERLADRSLILDLGCGAGLPVARWFVEAGHHVVGLDISHAMLDLARTNVPEAEYQLGDLSLLKPRQFTVDAVVSIFALFHIDRDLHAGFLRTTRTFLSDGGLLLISTGKAAWEGSEEFLGSKMSWSHFDGATYRKMIEECGYEVILEAEHPGSDSIDNDGHPIFLASAI